MRGEQFYRSQKKETSSLSQGMDENSRVENLSTFAFYKIFNRGAGEKRRKNFLASHRKERIRLRLLLPLLLFPSNRRTIKQKWRTRSILFSFYSTRLSSARERKRRVYTYAAWDDGGRKGEMSTSVEITRRPVGSDTLTRRCRVLERAHATGRCADWQERPHFTSIAAKIYDSPGGLARP